LKEAVFKDQSGVPVMLFQHLLYDNLACSFTDGVFSWSSPVRSLYQFVAYRCNGWSLCG